ncbi:hypothetical protein NEILACOT_03213 [Neisseria lactamica ATCC 23970]|uniref:Uncharacterized protein n=1 Tax=Neisseria lactamica ATCC 23970 TaxID=546265 RepID=D0W6S2_NEILA|nr:hypothetical protein NEILACOT_03213 [Neisseria lactamica ATCC 23970]KFJ35266.1 hypothetical protein DR91_1128 [Neisseria lactamica ATCC 23970]VTQ48972.1 Uncharacterised protein [Neisseria lactamica]
MDFTVDIGIFIFQIQVNRSPVNNVNISVNLNLTVPGDTDMRVFTIYIDGIPNGFLFPVFIKDGLYINLYITIKIDFVIRTFRFADSILFFVVLDPNTP